jgi:hypothetical protein
MASKPVEQNIGVDDIVASAATGVLRAFEARRIGAERLTVPQLVQSGFGVRFEIWAGGPWIRELGGIGGIGGPAGNPATGGIGGGV